MNLAGLLEMIGNAEAEQYASQTPISGLLGDWVANSAKRAKKYATTPTGLLGDVTQSLEEQMPLGFTSPAMNSVFDKAKLEKWADAAPNFAGIMAGVNSKTADLVKLERAKQLQAQGLPDNEIYAQTGWFNGMPDKKWRYEIPDHRFDMSYVSSANGDRAYLSKTGKVRHPDVIDGYPDAKKMTVVRNKRFQSDPDGSYQEIGDQVNINLGTGEYSNRGTALHEIQHAIQAREGFARGGSPDMFRQTNYSQEAIKDAYVLRSIMDGRGLDPHEAVNKFKEMFKRDPVVGANGAFTTYQLNELGALRSADPHKAYRNLAGEAEARLVQARMNMTPAERAASYPLDMLDVPLDQLIVRYGDGAMQYAPRGLLGAQ